MKNPNDLFATLIQQPDSSKVPPSAEKEPKKKNGVWRLQLGLVAKIILHPRQTLDEILHQPLSRAWLTPIVVVGAVVLISAAISAATATRTVTVSSSGQSSSRQFSNFAGGPMDLGGQPPSDFTTGGGQMPSGGQTAGGQSSGSSSQSNRTTTNRTSTRTPTPNGTAASSSTGSGTAAFTGNIGVTLLVSGAGFFLSWIILTMLVNVMTLAAGGQGHSQAALLITAWSFLPIGARNVIRILFYLAAGKSVAYPGLSGFLPNVNGNGLTAFFQSLLSNADLYLVWQTALLALGVGLAGKFSLRKSILIACLGITALLALQGLIAAGGTLLGTLNLNTGSLFFLR
jgi:hypothetical protein